MFLPGKTQTRQRHKTNQNNIVFLKFVGIIWPEGVRGSLHSAAAAGNVADIQRLIAGGASVNRSTLGGVAPLHMAAHNGHAEAIARLLSARAGVNQLAPGGTTALLLGPC